MPTVGQVWKLTQKGDYVFPIVPKDVYLHIPVVKNQSFFMVCVAV